MEKLSAESKRGQRFVEAYRKSTWHTLKDVYRKPSTAKQVAFNNCLQRYKAENGSRFRIISSGVYFFTVAFEVTTTLGTTELHVITASHDYLITL